MKLLYQYLRSRAIIVALMFAFILIFVIVFALYRLPLQTVLYPAGLCLLLGTGCGVVDFLWMVKRHKALEAFKQLESCLPEQLPEPGDVEAADWREIVQLLCDARHEDQRRAEADFTAMTDYYTLWAHQIKTPIAAMRLRLQDQDTAEARSLLSDLGRIERYVKMVMTYLRLEGNGTDYVIRECDLDSLLRTVFKQFSGEFISRKLKLDYTPVDVRVLTDEKWLGFVIEQVLSNALKYTSEGTISVYLEAPQTLCVQDTGIGIAPEDLPRIFEQSYTGLIGRECRQASGIGLYLCKRVCNNLGHKIFVRSKLGEGTTVCIDLNNQKLFVE